MKKRIGRTLSRFSEDECRQQTLVGVRWGRTTNIGSNSSDSSPISPQPAYPQPHAHAPTQRFSRKKRHHTFWTLRQIKSRLDIRFRHRGGLSHQ